MERKELDLMLRQIKLGARIVDNYYGTIVDISTEKGKILFLYNLVKLLFAVCIYDDTRARINYIIQELENTETHEDSKKNDKTMDKNRLVN